MNDDNTLMMSEELLGQVPDLEGQNLNKLIANLIVASLRDENTGVEISGPVSAILSSDEPEIELKMNLTSAFNILANKEKLNKVQAIKVLHNGVVFVIEGSFYVDLAKILDINLNEQTCVLALGLKKNPSDI